MPNHYAVMGNPVDHSLSPMIHQWFAKQTNRTLIYDKILINEPHFEQQVRDFFQAGGKGLNITLPCKQRAFAMSDEITPRCFHAKAANTLWMQAGKLYADNTDGLGLLKDLSRMIDLTGESILLLGAGGAARGVIRPLLEANPSKFTIANRTPEKAEALQQEFPRLKSCLMQDLRGAYDVLINATSASLDSQNWVLPEEMMAAQPFCYDLAYQAHGDTSFVAWAKALGCRAVDGLGMLVEQAAEAFYIWHGVKPDTGAVLCGLLSAKYAVL